MKFLVAKYSVAAEVALVTMDSFKLNPSILFIFGIVLFSLGLTYTIVALAYSKESGKVIGHTGSGKPIYMNHAHPSHENFTSKDHREAGELHGDIVRKANKKKQWEKAGKHVDQARLHEKMATFGPGQVYTSQKAKIG